jgi:hypothetical protein
LARGLDRANHVEGVGEIAIKEFWRATRIQLLELSASHRSNHELLKRPKKYDFTEPEASIANKFKRAEYGANATRRWVRP